MKATTITDRVMAHLRAAEIGPAATSVRGDALTGPRGGYFTRMTTYADMPARSVCGLPNSLGFRRIFTGTRWTTFTQLLVAFSGGSSEKRAPVPAASESTVPWKTWPGNVSISTVAGIPGRTRESWVSLK